MICNNIMKTRHLQDRYAVINVNQTQDNEQT